MTIEFTILGCGSSGGVPRVGQGWGICNPKNIRNRRKRCSLLVEQKSGAGCTRILIDTSPDLRTQLLEQNIQSIDAVLYTHEHADHTHGIDDLRGLVLFNRKRIDVYADADTSAMLMARFGYCFVAPEGSEYPPILNLHLIEPRREIELFGDGGAIKIMPIPVQHGQISALGFRINNYLYTPDLNAILNGTEAYFENLDCWIIDALRPIQHPSHFSLQDALQAIERFKPKRAILTNLHIDMDYDDLLSKLPQHIEPAYDGMQIQG